MTLPSLPKQNKSKEADFGIAFRKWWKLHPMRGEFEIKDTRGRPSFAFSELSDDQIAVGLSAVKKTGILVRRTSGTVGGADYSGLVESPYWIVIKFPKFFAVIDIETFALEHKRSKRKSLTSERAEMIAFLVVR